MFIGFIAFIELLGFMQGLYKISYGFHIGRVNVRFIQVLCRVYIGFIGFRAFRAGF